MNKQYAFISPANPAVPSTNATVSPVNPVLSLAIAAVSPATAVVSPSPCKGEEHKGVFTLSPFSPFRHSFSFSLFFLSCFVLSPFCADLYAFVSVSPTVSEFVGKPGKKLRGKFVVKNTKNTEMWVRMDVKESWNQMTGLSPVELDRWLSVRKLEPFKLKPGKSKTIRYKIRVPDTLTGEMMAVFFFSIDSKATPVDQTNPLNVEMRRGVPVYVVSKGSEDLQAQIKQFAARFLLDPSSSPTSAIEFSTLIENGGNVHFRPKALATIFHYDVPVETIKFNWGTPVFPAHQARFFGTSENNQWLPGEYRVQLEIQYGDLYNKSVQEKEEFKFEITSEKKIIHDEKK